MQSNFDTVALKGCLSSQLVDEVSFPPIESFLKGEKSKTNARNFSHNKQIKLEIFFGSDNTDK